jgi:uncharacterized OsmC-like protein
MSVTMTGRYLGDLKTELTHDLSGATLRTAAPLDNEGDGSTFSPTDLAAASLGTCVVTIYAIAARHEGLALDGAHFRIEKHMHPAPRRLGRVVIEVHLPRAIPEASRPHLERAGLACPIHRSLREEVVREVTFLYDVAMGS